MKKFLIFLSLLIGTTVAHALPFVPTTSPETMPIHWYYLKTGGRFVYASQSDDADIAASTSSQSNDSYYWCFVGNSSSGYKIYNRATHKYLYAGEWLGNIYDSPLDLVETRDNSSFYIYVMLGTLKNYLCYNTSNGFYTTMGKDSYFTVTEAFVEQGSTLSNLPDINVETFNDHCVVTATGTGEVHLYIGNDEVNNPHTIMRTNEDQHITAMATNKDPDKEMATIYYGFTVPKLEGSGPNPNPTFTRYDANGVGYSIEYGGSEQYGCVPQFVLDNNADTYFQASPDNCYVVMQASVPVAVKQYSLVTASDALYVYEYMIRSWKLEGSNDFQNWTLIDTQKDYPMPLVDLTEVVIPVNDTRKFRYFKFTCTEGAGIYNSVRLSEIWINKQNHGQWTQYDFKSSTCGAEGERYLKCSECNAKKSELVPPDGNHFFSDGVCTKCGIKEGETRLIYNSQRVPHYVKAKHGYRNSNGTWPSAPQGWNTTGFNDSNWLNLPLGTANPGHTDGPRYQLRYNSFWYGEYNCYWMRFPLILTEIANDATFTFNCVHDDNMVVYVNGQEVINKEGWCETPYGSTFANTHESYSIPASAFHRGKNVIAVYMQQNFGGAYFDCELVTTGVTAGDVIPGDVNGDGLVSSVDVTALYNYLLNNDTTAIVNGDQDGDGVITAVDITIIYNILLGN
ncbi:MAG: hypothetical protein IJK68_07870 [Muribaculaceae bacterium]|nr:hypothetical protein [Muribaculaceae bacterium]